MSAYLAAHQWLAAFIAMTSATCGIVAIDYFWRHRND